jgi:hypothetical protein
VPECPIPAHGATRLNQRNSGRSALSGFVPAETIKAKLLQQTAVRADCLPYSVQVVQNHLTLSLDGWDVKQSDVPIEIRTPDHWLEPVFRVRVPCVHKPLAAVSNQTNLEIIIRQHDDAVPEVSFVVLRTCDLESLHKQCILELHKLLRYRCWIHRPQIYVTGQSAAVNSCVTLKRGFAYLLKVRLAALRAGDRGQPLVVLGRLALVVEA